METVKFTATDQFNKNRIREDKEMTKQQQNNN